VNAVEIEAAVADLACQPFDAAEFPFAFLEAFGNNATTIKMLRKGTRNHSDVEGGVLQYNNIHIAVCDAGEVGNALKALGDSPQTAKAKAKFTLATDGETLEAEDLTSGETIVTEFADLAEHFGFFLPMAGISAVREIKDNPIDVRATGRLNKLYVELLKHNRDWAERRHDMNHFMARLIFCFFAEDTDIFENDGLFTRTIDRMSAPDGSNLAEIMSTLFRAMDIQREDPEKAKLPNWASDFPYVNGNLFSGTGDVPRFTKMARSYLVQAGNLDWKAINPDIFGSMIQAVADDDERGQIGMHYTSVPNILKVLNPLFLNDLREQLEDAGDNTRKLLNLRKRMARIRVFDPACGSGNFLVIAYKEMRAIEAEINQRRDETHLKSAIPLTNFRGIELRDFAAEIARLALVIAEYQCDVQYRGQKEALKDVLPLSTDNWITQGNALWLDWLAVCPPTGTGAKVASDDLFETPLDQAEIAFENEGGETYICGNPPYRGSKWQTKEQKSDLANAWSKYPKLAKSTDFVTGWFARFFDYADQVPEAVAAFVATNSVCQGEQATKIWPTAFGRDCEIQFARTSFKWSNLASHNAGVTVLVIGIGKRSSASKWLYEDEHVRECTAIGPYLLPDNTECVQQARSPIGEQATMFFGNMPRDGGHLLLDMEAAEQLRTDERTQPFIKQFVGSNEMINGLQRYCLWIEAKQVDAASQIPAISERLRRVTDNRSASRASSTRDFARKPYRFVQIAGTAAQSAIVVATVSSESREYLPAEFVTANTIVSNLAFALYDAPLWNLALIASKLHLLWIATVCGKLETRYRYSNTLGWNTFPVPALTEQNRADLTRCAGDILLAREAHFPATIAELYKPDEMPENLRHAHERNDEVLERIYIGRRFKNDTERLEKLFDLYTKMTAAEGKASVDARRKEHAS
jgi:hypothetical protein